MIQAAIVEDSPEAITYIRDVLSAECERQNLNMGFDLFSGGEAFLSMIDQHYHFDVLFLDIEMPGIDGFETCRRVRAIDPDALVVFISSREELVFQSFEVQPFRFIRKGILPEQAESLVSALADALSKRNQRIIHITEPLSKDIYAFNVRQIKYVEAQRKECVIACTDGDVTVKAKLMDVEAMLRTEPFIKVHRSYLVNCRYVFHIGKNSLLLTTRDEIPISRGKSEAIKAEYMRLIARGL